MPTVFPKPYPHDHPPVMNTNVVASQGLTFGERAADEVANQVGSWRFIVIQSVLLCLWVALNLFAWIRAWDPYPFILLNLFLSMQAAFTAPMLMMSQNRQAQIDRIRAEHDYQVNLKAEEEIRHILLHLEAQNEAILKIEINIEKLLLQSESRR